MSAARRPAAHALLLLAFSAAALEAQMPPGPWVPLGSRLDRMVGWLIADGGLPPLDALTRPHRMSAVRAAVSAQDTMSLSHAGRRALEWLSTELAATGDSSSVVAELGFGAWRNGRRDSFREGGGSGSGPMGGLWVSLARGPLVAVLNPAFENRLKDDPEFTGKTDRFIAGRLQTGYVTLTGAIGDVGYGRMARQWGPTLFDGLQLSPSAYATDQFWGSLRVGRFELSTIVQRLDDQRIDSVSLDTPINRYFLAHRLTVRVGTGTWLALTETGVYGGPGRGFEPAFHSPLGPALLSEYNEQRAVNLLWGAEAHARLGRVFALQAQAVLDDIQVDNSTSSDRRPWSGGFTVVGTVAVPDPSVHVSLGYTQVRSLMYRNSFAPYEVYAVRSVGIARNFSDYDQALLRLEARPGPAVEVTLEASYRRQGSADFRQPFPADSVLSQSGQGFLVPPVGRAAGARASVEAEPVSGLLLRGVLGVNQRSGGGSVGIIALDVRARFDVLRRRPGAVYPAVER